MTPFASGPFTFEPASRGLALHGKPARRWTVTYGSATLAERTLAADLTQDGVREAFADDISAFATAARRQHAADRIVLIDAESGDEIADFHSDSSCGMTPGLIDDRSKLWLCTKNRRYSRPVRSISHFAAIAAEHAATPNCWIAGLLPSDVLTSSADDWRAPSCWEIRHVVGEGSFTGISGARAAALVGVTAQNFRKYTAQDGARTRQHMSFAMWHLLLHKLGVARA